MLNPRYGQHGVSLIELTIGLVIVGILLVLGTPAFRSWIQNAQIRTTAEAIHNGLQLARAEAVHRNNLVRFQLMNSLTNTCAFSTTSSNWVVSQGDTGVVPPIVGDPSNSCASTPSDTTAPFIIQTRSSGEGSGNAVVAADQPCIAFNGLGRQVFTDPATCVIPAPPIPVAVNISINISNPTGGVCAPAGPMRCLRVVVTAGGQIRMCDPALAATDPQGC